MKFVVDIKKEDYIKFVDKHPKAHFLQSYEWGQFAKKQKGQIPIYVGVVDKNNKLLAAALLLKKNLPFSYSYIYCPRGFVIDFNDLKLLKFFTTSLKKYMEDNKVIYTRIDPDVVYCNLNENKTYPKVYNNLLKLGFIHQGFNKLYEGNQPRYTFRIDLKKDKEDIDKVMNKSFLKSVKRSYSYLIEIDNEPDIAKFNELNECNSKKDNFTAYGANYYQDFYEEFKKSKHVKFYNAYINPPEVIKNINEQKKIIEDKLETDKKHQADLLNQITRLNKDLEVMENLEQKRQMICSLICVYTKKYAWSLYIGSNDLANYTFAVSRCYYDSIMEAHDNGYEFYDLFGTVGDANTTYKNLAKLHDFKRKFGDQYLEFVGEFEKLWS